MYSPNGVPVYIQGKYKQHWNRDDTIAETGCGLCCACMVAEALSSKQFTPDNVAKWCMQNYYYSFAPFETIAKHLQTEAGYSWSGAGGTNWNAMVDGVNRGGLGVVQVSHGAFTTGRSHFMVITSIDNNSGFANVNDPNKGAVVYSLEQIRQNQVKCFLFIKH
jgi:ABC-type bacteriocin/lantibiotic exporter with double-glycine peptidase domain